MEPYYEDGKFNSDGQLGSTVVSLNHKCFTTRNFCELWQRGAPIVVQNVHTDLQGRWTPPDFIQEYGSKSVELIDCVTGDTHRSTVTAFFSLMFALEPSSNTIKLKVRSCILHAPDC